MLEHNFEFELGIEVISTISGFTGIITSRSQHLNGCDRYWVAPKVDKDGKLPDGIWMDDGELKTTKKENNVKVRKTVSPGGFPSKVK